MSKKIVCILFIVFLIISNFNFVLATSVNTNRNSFATNSSGNSSNTYTNEESQNNQTNNEVSGGFILFIIGAMSCFVTFCTRAASSAKSQYVPL